MQCGKRKKRAPIVSGAHQPVLVRRSVLVVKKETPSEFQKGSKLIYLMCFFISYYLKYILLSFQFFLFSLHF